VSGTVSQSASLPMFDVGGQAKIGSLRDRNPGLGSPTGGTAQGTGVLRVRRRRRKRRSWCRRR